MKIPEKVYIDDFGSGFSHGWHTEHSYEKDIEYVRKDVFIDKVVNFLEILGYAYTITDNITKSLYDNTQLIEDFKSYMED